MKQKYTLNIADIQLNVVADSDTESVDKIAGILDRKMREFYLHSKNCTKNEAALLCALEFCADRIDLQNRVNELEALNSKYDAVLKVIKTRNEELSAELDKAQNEITILRSLITARDGEAGAIPTAAKPIPPAEFLHEVAAQYDAAPAQPSKHAENADTESASAAGGTANTAHGAEAGDSAGETKPKRSRVGSMFDLLSFDEV